MKISVKGYITCKEAENYSDCADNYALNKKTNRFAISDGVTKSFFPKIWSKILVDDFVALEGATELSIEKCQSKWLEHVTKIVEAPNVKWFTKNAFFQKKSGLATFVSLYFGKEKWFAKALGDSFLFFIPRGKEENFNDWIKLSSKPEPVVFDNFPDYYSSREKAHGEAKTHEEQIESGTFFLMTDALSEWIFKEKENALKEIRKRWISQSEFERSVDELRKSQSLSNDDSTVLIIDIEDDGNNQYEYGEESVTNIDRLIEMEAKKEVIKEEAFVDEAKKEMDISMTKEGNTENEESTLELENSKTPEIESESTSNALESSSEKEVELSLNAKDILEYCYETIDKTIKEIDDTIVKGVKDGFLSAKKTIEVSERKIIKNKLKEKVWHFLQGLK